MPLGSTGLIEHPESAGENVSTAHTVRTLRRTVLDREMESGIIQLTQV